MKAGRVRLIQRPRSLRLYLREGLVEMLVLDARHLDAEDPDSPEHHARD